MGMACLKFHEKTFASGCKIVKFVKVFSLKSFLLYSKSNKKHVPGWGLFNVELIYITVCLLCKIIFYSYTSPKNMSFTPRIIYNILLI